MRLLAGKNSYFFSRDSRVTSCTDYDCVLHILLSHVNQGNRCGGHWEWPSTPGLEEGWEVEPQEEGVH